MSKQLSEKLSNRLDMQWRVIDGRPDSEGFTYVLPEQIDELRVLESSLSQAQADVEVLRRIVSANIELKSELALLRRVLRAAQAEWAFRLPLHDYGWTVSKEYHAIRTELADAVVDATLREAGYDPKQVGDHFAELARTTIAELIKEQADE